MANNQGQTNIELQKALDLYSSLRIEDYDINRDPTAKNDWDAYLTGQTVEPSSSISSLPGSYTINNMPHVYQYSSGIISPGTSCGPSSAAIISQYLYSIGKNVDGINTSGNSMIQLTNNIRNSPYFDVGFFGMSETVMRTSLHNYLNKNYSGSPWNVSIIYGHQSNALYNFRHRIASTRPPAIMWHNPPWPWLNPDVNWHWQVGYAYHVNTITWRTEFTVKDPARQSPGNRSFDYVANQNDFLYMRIIEQ